MVIYIIDYTDSYYYLVLYFTSIFMIHECSRIGSFLTKLPLIIACFVSSANNIHSQIFCVNSVGCCSRHPRVEMLTLCDSYKKHFQQLVAISVSICFSFQKLRFVVRLLKHKK